MYVCGQGTCHDMYVEVIQQLVGVSSFFPPCESGRLNSVCQTWASAALLNVPSSWLWFAFRAAGRLVCVVLEGEPLKRTKKWGESEMPSGIFSVWDCLSLCYSGLVPVRKVNCTSRCSGLRWFTEFSRIWKLYRQSCVPDCLSHWKPGDDTPTYRSIVGLLHTCEFDRHSFFHALLTLHSDIVKELSGVNSCAWPYSAWSRKVAFSIRESACKEPMAWTFIIL